MIFVLDTNILSEITNPRPEPLVLNWISGQAVKTLFTSAVTVHEIRYGLELMPKGRRRQTLELAMEKLLTDYFTGKVLSLDPKSARISGEIEASRKQIGHDPGMADCMIAGIAIANGATVVTRNVKHFATTGATVINPWGG